MEKKPDFFTWTEPQHGVGIKRVDDEIKKLIALINTLYLQQQAGAAHVELIRSIENLLDFTKKHFEHEEQYMDAADYPDLEHHRQLHAVLVEKLVQHIDEYVHDNSTLTIAFFNFLKAWLNMHIQNEDRKFASHSLAAA